MILYPAIRPYSTHRLSVSDIHELYIEESGNREGVPVLFIHGGPGGGCDPMHRRFFDPEKYRIILFDQRGAGRSTPHAELQENTTQHLLADIESIRAFLKIDTWMLFGGSWGSTLALLYAQAYPEVVKGLILRGIFLCREQDISWFYQHGASRVFPDAWREFCSPIPKKERDNMIDAYYKRLTGDDEIARMACAKAWSLWEGHCSTLRPNISVTDHFSEPHVAMSMARIESHYFKNDAFIKENQILKNMDKIKHLPAYIIHGRYDMVCPVDQAWSLWDTWPESTLDIVRDAGHSASEAGMIDALVRASDEMAEFFSD